MKPEWVHRGSQCRNSKLEECQIPEIRKMLSEGKSWQKIADYYYVSKGAIARIATGRGWKHVN